MQEGADFIIAETFGELAEAKLALECIKDVKKGQKRGQLRYSCGYIDHPTATSRTTLENPIDLDARPEKFHGNRLPKVHIANEYTSSLLNNVKNMY